MEVIRCSSSGMIPLCVGSRCWTTTKANPDAAGTCRKKSSSASRPPAEAPMPTTGKREGRFSAEGGGAFAGGAAAFVPFGLAAAFFFVTVPVPSPRRRTRPSQLDIQIGSWSYFRAE